MSLSSLDTPWVYDVKSMIYADYNATTPVDEEVVEILLRSMREDFGNPASVHHEFGQRASNAVEVARRQIAEAVGASPQGVIFTSGATESISIAIHGILALNNLLPPHQRRKQVLVGANEHKAVLAAVEKWSHHFGCSFLEIPCRSSGELDIDWLRENISDETVLVAAAGANNETGCINPMIQICQISHGSGANVFSDMTQVLGKLNLNLSEMGVDLAAISSHKIYGPKGVGALIGNQKVLRRMPAMQSGGGQENGLRGGTLNVPGIVGFGLATDLVVKRLDEYALRVGGLTRELESQLKKCIPDVMVIGSRCLRIPNTVSLRVANVDAEALLAHLVDLAISSGSACQSAVPAPSHVLVSMGLTHTEAREVVRISLGWQSTDRDIESIVSQLVHAVKTIRELEMAEK